MKEHVASRILSAMALAVALAFAPAALAAYTVHSPHVTAGENEIEWNSFASWGTNAYSGALQETKFEFGRGMNAYWKSELEFSAKKENDHSLRPSEFEFENIFQLTSRGKYWLDAGLYTEVEYARGGKYEITVGPIFSKRMGRFSARLNLFAAHEYGNNADAGISWQYRARIEYYWKRAVSPLFEFYGKPLGRTGAWGRPRNQIGPGVGGEIDLGGRDSLHYGIVALFGLSGAAADRTLVARLEYDFF